MEVSYYSHKLEEFDHVEGPEVCEVECQRFDSHMLLPSLIIVNCSACDGTNTVVPATGSERYFNAFSVINRSTYVIDKNMRFFL